MVARTYRPRRKYGLVGPTSVARVQPRTSKGITDLLLPQASVSWALTVPLRSQRHRPDRPIKERKKAKKKKALKKENQEELPPPDLPLQVLSLLLLPTLSLGLDG